MRTAGAIVALILCVSAGAAEAGKADDIRAQLEDKKAAHAALIQKSSALNSEVGSLQKNLLRISGDLRDTEETLSATEQTLSDLRARKAAVIATLYKDHQALGGLVSGVRKYEETSTVDMLAQSNPIDAARASTVMKSVLPRLQQESSTLRGQLEEIKSLESKITEQKALQNKQALKLGRQQDDLAVLLKERQTLYQSTENQRRAEEKEVARLTREARNIDELMAKIKEKEKARKQAKEEDDADDDVAENRKPTAVPAGLLLPVHGKLYTAFGQKDDLGAPSRGITLISRSGASVVTPLKGTVKFAGPFQKYKQILIVEHKGGYHSLIAGLARIDTVVGATLAAGEPVGAAETSDSPKIYYELRHNGKPINPQTSLLAQRKS